LRWLAAFCVIGLIVFGLIFSRASPEWLITTGQQLVGDIRDSGWIGVGAFVLLQLLATLSGVLPASLTAVAAGTIYGILPGFGIAATTTLVGAYLAFALSRSVFRPQIQRWIARNRKLQSLDEVVSVDGWRLVAMLRVSPVMPFSVTSYMLGLSRISLSDYLIGTLASLPALLGYVSLGVVTDAGLAAWTGSDSPIRSALLIIGALAIIAMAVWTVQTVIKLRAEWSASPNSVHPTSSKE
jgi:uncharacterized membrane protein YdjX (TVP38/TMEM64 family)